VAPIFYICFWREWLRQGESGLQTHATEPKRAGKSVMDLGLIRLVFGRNGGGREEGWTVRTERGGKKSEWGGFSSSTAVEMGIEGPRRDISPAAPQLT